jgi:hypothetical protein
VVEVPTLVLRLNSRPLFDGDLAYLVGNGVIAVARAPVDTGPEQKVGAKFEWMRMPQTVCDRTRPALSRPLFTLLVTPIASAASF